MGLPESHGAGEAGDTSGPDRTPAVATTGEPKLVYLTGKSQPTKLDKQCDLRLRKKTHSAEQTSITAGRPIGVSEPAPPVCHGRTGSLE